ncbi:MAG TPA: AAA family ATPase [Thermoplasmata archaeon]|nr:AAA family ATPase [Thermoplasmata archaeon]
MAVDLPAPVRFVGRLDILDQLRRRLDAAREGHGGVTILEGEVGTGKSTVLRLLAAECRGAGLEVRSGRSTAADNPPPFSLVRNALGESSAAGPRSGPTIASEFGLLPGPPAAEVMLGFAPTVEGDGAARTAEAQLLASLATTEDSTDGGRRRLIGQLADELLYEAGRRPTVMLLEDLHLADEASIEFLEFLGPQAVRAPLWVVASSLPVANLGGPRRAALERLEREAHAERITLRPLTQNEVAEYVRAIDPTHTVDAESVIRWFSQSGGNPLFLEQILKTPNVPATAPVQEAAVRSVAELPHDEQRIIGVASVLGREFPFGLLLKASGEDEERLAEITGGLVRRSFLRERPGEILEFVRDDWRGEVYQSLTDTRRRLLHRHAGEAIEAAAPADVAAIYSLARHYHLGRVDDKAAGYNRLAAEFAIRAHAPAVAVDHLERALDSHRRAAPEDVPGEFELVVALAVQLDRVGELRRAEGLLKSALVDPRIGEVAPRDRELARVYLARILVNEGRLDDAEATLAAAKYWGGEGAPAIELSTARLLGEIEYYRGEYLKSLAHHDRALAIARGMDDPREVALESVRRANVLGMVPGRVEEAIATYRDASEKLIAAGDPAEAAYAQLFLGVVLSQHGKNRDGLGVLRKAAELAESAHDPRRLGWALFNIADLSRDEGDLDGADRANRRSRAILEAIGDRFGLLQTYIISGKIRMSRGDLAGAELDLLEGFRLVRELHAPADELDVLLRLAEVALLRGDTEQARRRVKELERGEIGRFRPDLTEEFARLRGRVG